MSASTIALAIELALQLLTRSQQVSAVVLAAQQAGRTELTPEEWKTVTDLTDDSRAALVSAKEQAKTEGR